MNLNKDSYEVSNMQTWKTLGRRRVEANGPAFTAGEAGFKCWLISAKTTRVFFLNIVAVPSKTPLGKGKLPFTFRMPVSFLNYLYIFGFSFSIKKSATVRDL